jgi:ubiquitin carboxyl-terminal hydrolase L5
MDMLNSDLQLKNEATVRRSLGTRKQQDDTSSEAGFHFIAFVPALGCVWKFDGLERQPQDLGKWSVMVHRFWLTFFEVHTRVKIG